MQQMIFRMNDNEPKFNFRISFMVSGVGIDASEEKVRIFADRDVFLVSSVEGGAISDCRYLAVQGEGFETYRAASVEMLRVEQALKVAALKQHIGISTSNHGHDDYPVNVILRKTEASYLQKGIIFKQLVSRRVYPANLVVWDPEPSRESDLVGFEKLFGEAEKIYREFYVASPLSVAIDMLNAVHFEYSSMVRLILSMTVIEVLAGAGETRTNEEIAIVDELLLKIQESSLADGQKKSLCLAVNGCKSYSIGNACRKYVKRKLGKDRSSKFNDLYNYRSRLVHTGKIDMPLTSEEEQEAEIYKAAGEAFNLAFELVDAALNDYRNTGEDEFSK